MKKVAHSPHAHRRHRALWWVLGAIGALLIGTIVAFQVSPWPGAMIVRVVFTNGAAKVTKIMEPFAPGNVESTFNVDYKPGAPSAQLDVYWPDATSSPLPTIVWTHGGAWISGSKDNNVAYYQLLASKGYTVVGLNYGYGPEAKYPEAVFEINDALAFLLQNAADALAMRPEGSGPNGTNKGHIAVGVALHGDEVVIVVADDGIGLPGQDRDRLTEPYVTHKPKGTGLGLAIVKKIMEDHGGRVTLDDRVPEPDWPGTGAVVCLFLPPKPAA
jgi:hypothetical protein